MQDHKGLRFLMVMPFDFIVITSLRYEQYKVDFISDLLHAAASDYFISFQPLYRPVGSLSRHKANRVG